MATRIRQIVSLRGLGDLRGSSSSSKLVSNWQKTISRRGAEAQRELISETLKLKLHNLIDDGVQETWFP